MHTATPKTRPSARKVTGPTPGVYIHANTVTADTASQYSQVLRYIFVEFWMSPSAARPGRR